jgi:Flagellar hook-length control protein FliK
MKPHSNLHALSNPLLALQAAMGQQGLMLDASKDALLADAADTGFAGIMAKQLAQVSGEESMVAAEHQATTPVEASSVQEADEQGAAFAAMPEQGWAMELPVMPEQAMTALLNQPVEPKATVQVQTASDVMPKSARTTETSPLLGTHEAFVPSSPVTELPQASRAALPTVANSVAVNPGAVQPAETKLTASLPDQPAADAPKTKPIPVLADDSAPGTASSPSSTAAVRSALTDIERGKPVSSATASAERGKDIGRSLDAASMVNHVDGPRQLVSSSPVPEGRPTLMEAPGITSTRLSETSPQTAHASAGSTAVVSGADVSQTQPADVLRATPSVAIAKPMDTPAVKAPEVVPLSQSGAVVSDAKVPDAVLPEALRTMPAWTSAVPQVTNGAAKVSEGVTPLTLGAMLATARGVTRSEPSTVEAVTLRSIQRSTDASREVAQPLQNQFLAKFANAVDESLLPETPPMPMATTAAPVAGVLAEAVRPQHDQGLQGYDNTSMPTGLSLPAVASQVFQQPIRHEAASLQQTVGTAAFTDELIGQVNVWVKQSAQEGPMTAELHLNPADMGPVLIRIEVDGNQAQVNFAAQQADTRQAIESSMSMLSASLKEAGIQLSGSGVSDQGASSQQAWGFDGRGEGGQPRQSSQAFAMAAQQNQPSARGAPEALPEPWLPNTPSRPSSSASGLDLYA